MTTPTITRIAEICPNAKCGAVDSIVLSQGWRLIGSAKYTYGKCNACGCRVKIRKIKNK